MRYLTDRKRAEGKGAAGTGTEHYWHMKMSGVGLALIMPVFLVAFGRALGGSRTEVLETFAHPGMAILTGMLFGLLPAYRASRLDPVVALRYE